MWMKRLIVLLAAFLLPAGAAFGQSLSRGPFIQNPDALTTTMTIEWWTDVAGDSTVEYGTTPSLGSSVNVGQAGSCAIGGAGTCHTVPLTGLLPGTRYYYRLLTNGSQVLATTYFQTTRAPTDTGDILFTVIGDWGANSGSQSNVANNQNAADPSLLMTVGDNAYQNGTQSDWDTDALIPQYENQLLRRALFMTALGNHDLNNVGASNWANSVEIKMFLNPRNAPAGQEERFYSFDDGNAHFIVLDANSPAIGSTQNNWLAADLAATTRKWKFVFLHQTPYSCANGLASIGPDANVRSSWGPLFEQYGVDIVFTGHDHIYEKSKVVDDFLVGGGSGSDGLGTRYLMTGGGGQTLDSSANSDGGGPYRQPLFGSKTYCPWLANDCSNGVGGQYCSFATFHHTEVRLVNDTTLTVRGIDQSNNVFDTLTIVKGAVCGNGTVEAGEQCDQGANNGATGFCCTAGCQLVGSGTQCRTSAGVCDVAENCTGASGTCPGDGFAPSSTVCRSAAGVCDVPESCTGSAAACPANGFASSSTVCRSSAGVCDPAESCPGTGAACPGDAKSTAVCRSAAGVCDVPESCDGVSNGCPADLKSGAVCRSAAGFCDVAESCDGVSNGCPADLKSGAVCRSAAGFCDVAESCDGVSNGCPADLKSTAVCRSAAGVCDVMESCDGVGNDCPGDGFILSGTLCRSSAGVCDVPESCTGSSAACPGDALLASGTVCRSSAGVCDVAESCTGTSAACPPEGFAPPTTVCRSSAGVCDLAESCPGTGPACPADAKSTSPCRAATGGCDLAESCDGVADDCPADQFAASGTECRGVAGPCDVAESCSGTDANCPSNGFAASGTVCRSSAGVCDVAETCTGTSSACPADALLASGAVCRSAAGACDLAESCTGSSASCPADAKSTAVCRSATGACDAVEACDGLSDGCPADGFAASGTPCRSAAGACDVAESCTGTSAACPGNGFAPSGTVCRSAAGVCDVAESCTGASASCPANVFAPSSTVCRSSAGACDPAESCTGTSAGCPADAKSTAVCRSAAGVCDVAESCDGVSNGCPADVFAASSTVCRSAAGVCDVAETCTGSAAACPADAKSTVVCRSAAGVCDVAESCDGVGDLCPADQFASSTVECRSAVGACDVAELCTGSSNACPPDVGQADGDGDGVCDAQDDCPAAYDPGQDDADHDGAGDACDPCTNGVTVASPKVTITKLITPPGDDRLTFKGEMTFPFPFNPAFYPVGVGARVLLEDALGASLVDVTIPSGFYDFQTLTGWSSNGHGTWTYKNPAGIQGIVKVVLKSITGRPGLIKFTVVGKYGSWPLSPARIPVRGTMVVDAPVATTGQCGEASFPGLPGPACLFNPNGNTLKCK